MFFTTRGQQNVHLNLFSKLNKIAFSSPLKGEILKISCVRGKKKCLLLTKWDQISFDNFMGRAEPRAEPTNPISHGKLSDHASVAHGFAIYRYAYRADL
jgi:hypothetical protein